LESIWYGDDDQIRRHQEHDKALAALLRRVEARGGPAAPWRVNLKEHNATIGPMVVTFYKLLSRSFSLAHYRRRIGETRTGLNCRRQRIRHGAERDFQHPRAGLGRYRGGQLHHGIAICPTAQRARAMPLRLPPALTQVRVIERDCNDRRSAGSQPQSAQHDTQTATIGDPWRSLGS